MSDSAEIIRTIASAVCAGVMSLFVRISFLTWSLVGFDPSDLSLYLFFLASGVMSLIHSKTDHFQTLVIASSFARIVLVASKIIFSFFPSSVLSSSVEASKEATPPEFQLYLSLLVANTAVIIW